MAEFREIADGLAFAEGPIALPDGDIIFVETLGGCLSRVTPSGEKTIIAALGGGPNGAAMGPDGRCYVCNNGGITPEEITNLMDDTKPDATDPGEPLGRIEAVDINTGAFEVLYESCGDFPLVAPNDLAFDTHGGFYFTDFGSLRIRAPQPSHLYYALPDGSEIRQLCGPLERTNGIGVSPDGKTLYTVETNAGRAWAFDITAPGEIKTAGGLGCGGRLVFEGDLHFDSLAIDSAGHICVACPGNNLVARVSPNGDLETFDTPDDGPTNICFGGPDLKTAYITLGGSGKLLAMEWPVPGMPVPFVNS